ncbi:MAG TPA: NADP-dependent oxidoreductase [Solirubrobacterales bacterium]
MKAFVLEDFDTEPRLRDDLPDAPDPGDGEIVVRVQASSVNPVDNAVASGGMSQFAEYRFPVIIGRDFAGIVERVGTDAWFSEGDEVFGFVQAVDENVHNGSWTELARVSPGQAAAKPAGVEFAAAGAAPVAALTALSAINALQLKEGESVVIIGATGGVGSFATQLAKRAGANVIAPGLPEDEEYLADLGADHVIPRDGDVIEGTRGIESNGVAALVDNVSPSPEQLEAYTPALAEGGRVASPLRAAGDGPGRHNIGGDPEGLMQLAELLAGGSLRVPVQRTYPLEDADSALADLPGKHTQGKLAIAVAS